MPYIEVYPAEPYRHGALGSFGKAKVMLLAQFDFPETSDDESEEITSMYSDRLDDQKPDRVATCLQRYGLGGKSFDSVSHVFEGWVRKQSKARLIAFIVEVLGVANETMWTGCRVTGTVGSNGHALFSLQLFARNPNGSTRVYTGEPAPNVLPGPRQR